MAWARAVFKLRNPAVASGTAYRKEQSAPGRGELYTEPDQQGVPTSVHHPPIETAGHDEEEPAADAGVQIIVTTDLGSATARFEALIAGTDEYMTKPIQFGALMEMLNKRMEDRAAARAPPPG